MWYYVITRPKVTIVSRPWIKGNAALGAVYCEADVQSTLGYKAEHVRNGVNLGRQTAKDEEVVALRGCTRPVCVITD